MYQDFRTRKMPPVDGLSANTQKRGLIPRPKVSFTINGKPYTVSEEHSQLVLHEFLVQVAGLRNAKSTCYQGACGACVVAATFQDPVTQAPKTIAFNSCLRPVFACDGWNIITTEGLGNSFKGFHPIQEKLADKNGSQCGWCSPGMVMSMYGYMKDNKNMKQEELARVLDGNTCRCTGYRPIMDAFQALVKEKPCVDIEDLRVDGKICEKTGLACSGTCSKKEGPDTDNIDVTPRANDWYSPNSLDDLFGILKSRNGQNAFFVMGNTSTALYQDDFDIFIDIKGVSELYEYKISENELKFGGNLTLANLIRLLDEASLTPGYEYGKVVADHIRKVATTPLRNVGSWAGNLMIKRRHQTFPSDIFVLFETLNAKITVGGGNGVVNNLSPAEMMKFDMNNKVILSVNMPKFTKDDFLQSYKIMPRALSAYAYTNEAVWLNVDRSANFTVRSARIVFGGVSETVFHALKTEKFIVGKKLGTDEGLQETLKVLEEEMKTVPAIEEKVLADPSYRKNLVCSLFYKAVLTLLGDHVSPRFRSGASDLEFPIHQGHQMFKSDPSKYPLSQPMPKVQAKKQASGEAEYVMSVPEPHGTLHGQLVLASLGNCRIDKIDASEALAYPGVERFFTAADIIGANNISLFNVAIQEEVFASDEVLYAGQSIGLIVADTPQAAKAAVKLVKVTYKDVKPPILTIEDAIKANAFHPEVSLNHVVGDSENAIKGSIRKVTGELHLGDQYHFHMENQMAFCIPTEVGMDVYATTQWPDYVQKGISVITNMKNSGINVKVRRLGGGYGAKCTRTPLVSSACGLAAHLLNRPVHLALTLNANMQLIGKRFPYYAKYEAGVTNDGKLNGVKLEIYQETGATATDGPLIMMEFLGWIDNVYKCDNWTIAVRGVKTNKPSNTFCRSPGSVPGIFMMETVMEHLAGQLNKDPLEFKKVNMYKKGDVTMHGQPLHDCRIIEMCERLEKNAELSKRRAEVEAFNKANRWRKRGLGMVPMKYGVSWSIMQHGVMVNIYNGDGTVNISHGGVEIGQGINTKAMQVCAYKLGIPMDNIVTMHTDTVATANSMVTGGSITSEIICHGVLECCNMLIERMKPIKETMPPEATWQQLVAKCFFAGIDLSAKFWSRPGTMQTEHNMYVTYGVTCADIELDVLTGCRKVNRVDIVYDCGDSMNPDIDIGQAEGAFVMGLGYYFIEKSKYDPETGRNLTDNVWEYHLPTPKDIPFDFRIEFIPNATNKSGILGSKAVGEPPQTMSCAVLFGLKHAIEAARKENNVEEHFELGAPATVEAAQPLCLNNISQFKI